MRAQKVRFGQLADFASKTNQEVGNFRLAFILSPDKIRRDDYNLEELNWDSISFGEDSEIEKIPDDKRGIYALAICYPSRVLPPHGFIIYVGIAGRRSDRPLRERYKDYFNEKRIQKERPHLAYAIGTWQDVLRFYFAPINDDFSSEDLERLEEQINTSLLPPYSRGDLEADTKQKRKAFP